MSNFDPQAATAKYIDSLGPEALQRAHDYTVGDHWLMLWGLVVSAIVTWLIVKSGVLDKVERKFAGRRPFLGAFLVTATYAVVSALLSLPWSLYSGYFREKGYDRTSQPLGDYLGQQGLGLVLSALAIGIFMACVYALMRRTGSRWWAWASGVAVAFLAFFMLIAPVVIQPMFNRYEPIPAGKVHDAVAEMAARAGIPEDRIFMFDGSRQSNNFTANAGGIGSTARVAISDVALKEASLDEVRAVTAHEIGHYTLGHTYYGLAAFALLTLLMFWAADRSFPRFARAFGSNARIADPRGVPILFFMFGLFMTLASPLLNSLIRVNETAADNYSLRMENRPDALATALVKTAEYRYPRPGGVEEIVFYDHPSVENRVLNAMKWKAAHPPSPTP